MIDVFFIDSYFIAKWLHILSSTVLFGTGIGTAFQMVWAMRSRNPQIIHSTASGVVVADWLFTTPAGLIQPATGYWLITVQGFSLAEPWLLASFALYGLAFLCWVPVVLLQIRIRDLAATAARQNAVLPQKAIQLYRLWFALGWPAFLGLMGVFWLMITKPDLAL